MLSQKTLISGLVLALIVPIFIYGIFQLNTESVNLFQENRANISEIGYESFIADNQSYRNKTVFFTGKVVDYYTLINDTVMIVGTRIGPGGFGYDYLYTVHENAEDSTPIEKLEGNNILYRRVSVWGKYTDNGYHPLTNTTIPVIRASKIKTHERIRVR